jgi:lipoprotein signal peptidase
MRKRFFSLIILIGIALDMASEYLAEIYLGTPIHLVPDWVQLKLAYNAGIAFSLPVQGVFLQILTLVLIFGLIVYYGNTEKVKKSRLLDTGYALVLS